jgi:ribonuclease-3
MSEGTGGPGSPGAAPEPLQAALGYEFRDPALLRTALTHRSYLHDVGEDAAQSNERLEFLGDAVLGFLVTRRLYRRYPQHAEGQLTRMRGDLVRLERLTAWGHALDLGRYLYLSKGDDAHGGRDGARVIGRAMEALIGAVYVDGGLRAADALLGRLMSLTPDTATTAETSPDYKSGLQHEVQSRLKQQPEYRLLDVSGPDHDRRFTVEVWAGGHLLGQGAGRNKRQAEQAAAQAGLAAVATLPAAESAAPDPAPPPKGIMRGDHEPR